MNKYGYSEEAWESAKIEGTIILQGYFSELGGHKRMCALFKIKRRKLTSRMVKMKLEIEEIE